MTAPRGGRPGWFERAYALGLYLLPRAYRREYGSAMGQLVSDLLRGARCSPARFAEARLVFRLLRDLGMTVVIQHAEALRAAPPHRRFMVPAVAAVALLAIASTGRVSMLLGDAVDDRQRLDHATWFTAASVRAIDAARSLAASPQARDAAVAAMLLRVADDLARGNPAVIAADGEAPLTPLKDADQLMVRALQDGGDDPVVLAIATWHCPAAPAACQHAYAQARWRTLDPRNALSWWPAARDTAPRLAMERMAAASHATDPAWIARRIAHRALATTTTQPWPKLDPRLPGEQATAWMLTRQAFENRRERRLGPLCIEGKGPAHHPDDRETCTLAALRLFQLAVTYRDQFSAAGVLRHLGVATPDALVTEVAESEQHLRRAGDLETIAFGPGATAAFPFGPAELAESLNASNERAAIDFLVSRRGLSSAH